MSSNNNFLLKLHMEEDGNTTEIYLNKERRTFTFINDECISDLIIPEFKITSLHMILKNISESTGNDDYYAEYEKDEETVREYDREKIEVLSNLITKIKLNDFLDYQKDININEYYVDNVIDAYDCVLPLEMKKILSYTTNGVVFSGEEIYYFMPHDDITSYDGKIKNFIPFMIHKGKSYIGYDYKESLYKEYLDDKLINDGKTLEELLNLEEIELIGEEEDVIEEVAFDDTTEETANDEIEEIIEETDETVEEPVEIIDEPVIEETTEETPNEEIEEIIEEIDETVEDKTEIIDEPVIEENTEETPNDEIEEITEEVEISEKEQLEKIEEAIKVSKEDLKEELERIEKEYEETIKNIDLQFERLNAGIVQPEKKEEYHFKEKEESVDENVEVVEEPVIEETTEETSKEVVVEDDIKEEIRIGVRKSLDEIEKTNDIIDEIDNDMQKVIEKAKKIKKEQKDTKVKEPATQSVLISEEVGREAEEILKKLNEEIASLEKAKEKAKEENIVISEEKTEEVPDTFELEKTEEENVEETAISERIAKEAEEILAKLEEEAKQIEAAKEEANIKAVVISEEIGKEALAILEKLNKEAELINEVKESASSQNIVISEEIGKEAEKILAKLEAEKALAKINTEIEKLDQVKENAKQKINISEELQKQADVIFTKLEKEVKEKERLIEEQRIAKEKIKEERKKAREIKAKQDKEDLLNLTNLVNNSIYNGFDNYKINFNDTQKLLVEHLPYYEIPTDFSVIQIPEIEYQKLTILPGASINLGRIKLNVEKCSEDSVEFSVQTVSTIVDKDGNKIKKGDIITIKLDEKTDIRLSKKQAMETWSLKIEKSTFEKELRNIDFKKIMSLIVGLESFKKLGNIEKYELQKALMLFLNFVMENKDFKALDELYEIINKKEDLYEEYITRYNNEQSLKNKDSLRTYEEKKAYLTKMNYINGLIDAKWLDYPRYIYSSHDYFEKDEFLDEFLDELNNSLKEHDFYDYLMKLFNEYEMFKDLDEVGKDNLDKCIDYLSRLYKHNPELSEDNKYKIEKSFMIGATEEEMALLISKLCRRGIRDYSVFVEYNALMRDKYLMGELKYPVYSEYFEIEEIRNGGEYDEF